jgi:transposase-like protein
MSHNQDGKVSGEVPETEVAAKAQRRQYSFEYKQRILAEIDACTEPGLVGAILRREGLYSQLISKWRQQLKRHGQAGLEAQKRGPKADPQATELARLQRENERLRQRLERAEMIIEVQKKVSKLLNLPPESDLDEPK